MVSVWPFLLAAVVAAANPSLPVWGPEVSLNVSLGGSLQYSFSRQELFLFSESPQLHDLYWEFYEWHEVIHEAPYFGVHLDCAGLTMSFYIPDVLLDGLVCYTLPSRMSMDLLNNACPLTNDAFQYFIQYKEANVTYLGNLKYGYDQISNVNAWGVSRLSSWQYCCNPSYVGYRDWCCPMYYDATTSRQPVAFKGRTNERSLYTSGWATPASWIPPTASSCRRINPDIVYSAPYPTAEVASAGDAGDASVASSSSSPALGHGHAAASAVPARPKLVGQDMEPVMDLEMEDATHPLVSLLWSKMKKTNDIYSVFSFLSLGVPQPEEEEVRPPMGDVTNDLPKVTPPHGGMHHGDHMITMPAHDGNSHVTSEGVNGHSHHGAHVSTEDHMKGDYMKGDHMKGDHMKAMDGSQRPHMRGRRMRH
jgi:hypothetical protein